MMGSWWVDLVLRIVSCVSCVFHDIPVLSSFGVQQEVLALVIVAGERIHVYMLAFPSF